MLNVLLLFTLSLAEDIRANYKRCYDGDTCTVDIPIDNLPDIFSKNISVRINGVDTPEIRGKCQLEKCLAYIARDMVRERLDGKEINLANVAKDKYFRVLADLQYREDASSEWINIVDIIIANGLGVEYNGGTKTADYCSWADDTPWYEYTTQCRETKACVEEEYQAGRPLKNRECS